MAKEKISTHNKKVIANMGLHGKQFSNLAKLLGVSETTTRKADKIGSLLNIIDGLNDKINSLEYDNRSKDVKIMMLQAQRFAQPFKKSKHK